MKEEKITLSEIYTLIELVNYKLTLVFGQEYTYLINLRKKLEHQERLLRKSDE